MMALTLQLRSRVKSNTCSSLTLTHRCYSDDASSKSPFASYFGDVKDKLKNTQPTPPLPRTSTSTKVGSLDEIRKNLSEFRRPTSSGDPSSEPISFQEIYNKNVSDKSGQSAGNAGGKISWDSIKARMQQLRPSSENKQGGGDPSPLLAFRNSLKSNPSDSAISSSSVIGGTGGLPSAIFGKEMREKRSSAASAAAATVFAKAYSHAELGAKLRKLRPEGGGKERFSLAELNERLKRLREMDDKESASKLHGIEVQVLKESLMRLKVSEEETAMKTSLQSIDILGHLGRIPSSMMHPPKEHLVERYFHPDNMSSAEKLKIQLAKVRDEFKMSESDCGSARVQVAQLTTKIKHLSSVLHKKDKHSRKGLLAMVQRRKRLLKYLRSTDWDSYCFVISKLGLRDNPDIKA